MNGRRIAMTKPQRQALYSLAFLVWVALHVALLFIGIDWLTVAFILTSLIAILCVVIWYATRKKPGGAATKPAIEKDERDERILSRVPKYQNAAAMIALMIWLLVLMGRYDYAFDEVPVKLVFIMIWSVVIVDCVSYLVGILIAYWLAKRRGT
jgi:hypothetical protein